jgi:uncharacterized protein
LLLRLPAQFASDCATYSAAAAVVRVGRALRAWPMFDMRRRLEANAAYRRHIALVARDDPLFYLSHRHYLAKGLTPEQRTAAALCHYEHEVAAFDDGYFDAVYRQGALVLWRHDFEGHAFDVRLMPGNDVLYEGGLSIVLHCDGARVAVLSYSTVPSASFLPGPAGPAHVLFVTRKQLGQNYAYQKAFNKAFDRSTPGHLCFGALAGLALAQQMDRVVAIVAATHPSCAPAIEAHMKAAYDEFWASLDAAAGSPFGHVIDLPMRLTPLEDLDAKARKRAVARREHIRAVQESAQQTIARHLRQPPR